MYPLLPAPTAADALQLLAYVFAVFGAAVSSLLMALRS